MAGGSSSRFDEGKKKARIEIIPLIDVIFFLLATFVLFTLSLKQIKSIPVQLPVANNQPKSLTTTRSPSSFQTRAPVTGTAS